MTSSTTSGRLQARYGDWALVTGASDGLGREFAGLLAADGMNVVLVARRENALDDLARELKTEHGIQARVLPADLSSNGGVQHVLDATSDLHVGLLIAAAGFGTGGDLVDSPIQREIDLVQVNCVAPLVMAQHYGNLMARRRVGAIVLIGSIVGFQGVVGQANYSASKAYIQSLGEALNGELAARDVQVVVSAPGPINTGFGQQAGLNLSSGAGPREVAAATPKRLPRAGSVFPGSRAKLLGYGTGLLPRRVRTRVISSAVASLRTS